jgi:hypothetical protein
VNLSIAVVGAARVGKTLFCINFAEYLGARILSYTQSGGAGQGRGALSPDAARERMVNHGRRGNGVVRTFTVHLPQRKPYRRIALIDTASLKENNPLPRSGRSALLLTLQAIHSAAVVLQMIDLSCGDPARHEFDDRVGRHLADYCRWQGKLFLIAGSKADLPVNSHQARIAVSGKMLFISSLTRAGFSRLQSAILGEASSLNG